MKKLPFFLSLILAFSLLLAACAPAGEQGEEPGPGATEVVQETPVAEATEDPDAGEPEAVQEHIDLVSELIGQTVLNRKGENELAEIDSLLVDRQSGRIGYVLLGGVEGADGLVAVPWEPLQVNLNEGEAPSITFNMDGDALVNAPVIDVDAVDFADAAWDDEIVNYWADQVASLPNTGSGEQAGLAHLRDATDVQLVNADGEDIGDVEDMVLDAKQGLITYVIWGAGGFLDIAEELIPVPFERLSWEVNEDIERMVLNVSPEQLENAPTLASLDEVNTLKANWDEEFRAFWNKITK
jgi:sporulation protein YlmC with PRC-barrel domain